MLKFIADTQLPPAPARVLSKQGYDVMHTTDFPQGHLLTDKAIRVIATAEARIIITKDNDFYDNFMLKGSPPQVLFLQVGNLKNKDLFTILENNFGQITALFESGANLIQLDRDRLVAY